MKARICFSYDHNPLETAYQIWTILVKNFRCKIGFLYDVNSCSEFRRAMETSNLFLYKENKLWYGELSLVMKGSVFILLLPVGISICWLEFFV